MRIEDIGYHYDIFEKLEVNGFTVVATVIYADVKGLRREYVKERPFWFQIFIFEPDGSLIPDQRQILGYENIDYDRITTEINTFLLKKSLCI